MLTAFPEQAEPLKREIEAGHISGTHYVVCEDNYGCIKGTLAHLSGVRNHRLLKPTVFDSPVEKITLYINPGDTPANNRFSKLLHDLIVDWQHK